MTFLASLLRHATLGVAVSTLPVAVLAQATPVRAKIVGTVFDSTDARWLNGATIQLMDAANPSSIRTATAASNGRFTIDSIAAGTYLIGFFHSRLDQLGLEGPLYRVSVTTADDIDVALATPSAETVIARQCGPSDPQDPTGLHLGYVRAAADNQPVAGARVRAQYAEVTVGPRGVERRFPSRFGSTSDVGLFALCGVPRNAQVTARAYAGADSTGFIELRVPRNGLLVRDLMIGSTGKGTGTVRGSVKSINGQPLTSARIVLWGASGNGASSMNGQFTLQGVPTGTQMVEARAIGFQPTRIVVDVPATEEATADIALDILVPTVDTMRVRGARVSPGMAEFETRRRTGFGNFIDENQLVQRAPMFMADIFRTVPGITIQSGQSAQGRVLMRGVSGGGPCVPAVFLNGMNIAIPDGNLDAILNPQEVIGVEVYSRTASVPPQFDSRNGCGSLVIWTGARKSNR
jgi:hypothetical protein